MKAEHTTDTNNSFQKASEGEVSFSKKTKKFNCDYTLPPMEFSPCCDRFPVDDEHSQNKI